VNEFPDLKMSLYVLEEKEENLYKYYFCSNLPFDKIYYGRSEEQIKSVIMMGFSGLVGGLLEKLADANKKVLTGRIKYGITKDTIDED